jgi:hypothetical protein
MCDAGFSIASNMISGLPPIQKQWAVTGAAHYFHLPAFFC